MKLYGDRDGDVKRKKRCENFTTRHTHANNNGIAQSKQRKRRRVERKKKNWQEISHMQ